MRNDRLSDQKLVEQIALGNELAFAHFYDIHWDSLFISSFKVLKDEEASKDIVQEVFLSVLENPNLTDIDNIKAYLYQSIRNKALMVLRKGKISNKHLETIEALVGNTTEEQLHFQELNETIESSVKSLPKKCQEVFILSRNENLSNQEIANKLCISVRTVETHISNALRQIRSKLDSTAAALIIALFFHF